nr:12978_t:CDS:2 [Entrophospora candida]
MELRLIPVKFSNFDRIENVHVKVAGIRLDAPYIKGLEQNVIDLACDEDIFRRTKTYHNANLTGRFILGQWHTQNLWLMP